MFRSKRKVLKNISETPLLELDQGTWLCRTPLCDFLVDLGRYWTNLEISFYLDPSILHVFFDLSIWTCLFGPAYFDLSVLTCLFWTHLFGPVSVELFIWTNLFEPIYLDLSIWTRLFGSYRDRYF